MPSGTASPAQPGGTGAALLAQLCLLGPGTAPVCPQSRGEQGCSPGQRSGGASCVWRAPTPAGCCPALPAAPCQLLRCLWGNRTSLSSASPVPGPHLMPGARQICSLALPLPVLTASQAGCRQHVGMGGSTPELPPHPAVPPVWAAHTPPGSLPGGQGVPAAGASIQGLLGHLGSTPGQFPSPVPGRFQTSCRTSLQTRPGSPAAMCAHIAHKSRGITAPEEEQQLAWPEEQLLPSSHCPREALPRCSPDPAVPARPGSSSLCSATFLTGTAQPGTLALPLAHPRAGSAFRRELGIPGSTRDTQESL